MTRLFWALGIAALWAGAVQAEPVSSPTPIPQTPAPEARSSYDPVVDARERERIASEREGIQRRTDEAEADCYQRFAVNVCLRDVRKQRRAALEVLRKQELALNDAKRTAATEAQARKVQEREAEKERGKPAGDSPSTTGAAKSSKSAVSATPASGSTREGGNKVNSASEEAQRRERLQREYAEKQRLARERQEARDQKLQNNSSRSLPVPP